MGLDFFCVGFSNSYVRGLDFLRFGVSNSYLLGLVILLLWQQEKKVLDEKDIAVVKLRQSETKGPETKYN